MANTIPGTYPLPDPAETTAGEAIAIEQGQKALDASNWHAAAPCGRIDQCWNDLDDPCQRSAVMPAMPIVGAFGAHVARWPVAAYGNRTDLELLVYGRRDGAVGTVRFRSVNTGNTVDLALGPADGYSAVGALTLGFSIGRDWVEMYLAGDGAGGDVHVYTVHADFPALTGALAAPAAASDPTPFDGVELDADEPWSPDLNDFLRDNVEVFLGWLQPYLVWSGIQNTSTGSKASYSMPLWHHQVVTSVHPGALREGLAWTGRAAVTNVSGAAETVLVGVGPSDAEASDKTVVDVPGPAGAKFATPDVQPSDVDERGRPQVFVAGMEHPVSFITLYSSADSADLNAIGLWGV